MVRIVVLIENKVYRPKLIAEHGLSLFVEVDGTKFLFDLGQNGNTLVFNAHQLHIPLEDINFLVLSHNHYDHTGGLIEISNLVRRGKMLIYGHPFLLRPKYKLEDGIRKYIGMPIISEADMKEKFFLDLAFLPRRINKNIYLSGEIMDYGYPMAFNDAFLLADGSRDLFLDETAIYIKSGDELIVISGCSHRGILNIIEQGKKVTKTDSVRAVIGGFHVKGTDQKIIEDLIDGFKKMHVKEIYPMHCTSPSAICQLSFGFKRHCKILECGNEIVFS